MSGGPDRMPRQDAAPFAVSRDCPSPGGPARKEPAGTGNPEEAYPLLESLFHSLRAKDVSSGASLKLGELCFSLGLFEEAQCFFRKAASADPQSHDALNNLGVLHFQHAEYPEAERCFLQAIGLSPGAKEPRSNLAALYARMPSMAQTSDPSRAACPCCGGNFPTFIPGGVRLRPRAQCPRCGSLERHRLLWLYLAERTDLFTAPLKVLHFAPEPFFQDALRALPGIDYTSADLCSPAAMVKMDITDIRYGDDSFDAILCNHVLEHIVDDRKAMTELYRVLRPGGWAVLQVPIDPAREKTFEDPAVTSPEERARLFGQSDHVRWYGRDYGDRLRGAGFHIRVDDFAWTLSEDRVRECGIVREDIYLCSKPRPNSATRPEIPPGSWPGRKDARLYQDVAVIRPD